jgi:hypothetical protein
MVAIRATMAMIAMMGNMMAMMGYDGNGGI